MTRSQQALAQPDPYQFSIAHFVYRTTDRDCKTITFFFADQSTLTFKISYTPVEVE